MRRLLSIVLAVSICMITVVSYAVDETVNSINNTENEVNQTTVGENNNTTNNSQRNDLEVEGLNKLKGQKENIKQQIDEANKELEEVENELTRNLEQIAKIDKNIEETQQTLDDLNSEIENIQNEVDTLQTKLAALTEEYEQKQQMLDERLVSVYKAGETQYLDVLLKSSNLTDFISSYFLIQQLIDNDIKLLDVVKSEKKEMELQDLILSNKQENMQQQKQIQIKTQKVLENTKVLRNNLISKLSEEEQEIQLKIDEYNAQVSEIEREIVALAKTESFGEDYVGGTMQWPIPGYNKITSYYGMRTHPITGLYKLHSGVDVGAPTGSDFRAMAYGIVIKAEPNTAYGNMVIVDHGGGVQTLYAHGSSIEVEVGQVVYAGDIVLKVGSTGYSTGPHAHFEIRINGTTVDPLDYVAIPQN